MEGMRLREALAEALDLVVPVYCAGCGRPGSALCWRCEAPLYEPPRRTEVGATLMPVWAVAEYEGDVRTAVLAWKRGRVDLARRIEDAYRELTDRWRASEGRETAVGMVVPAPSGWRRRVSGTFVVGGAAAAVAETLDVPCRDVLRKRGGNHSGGLGALARSRNAGRVRTVTGDLPDTALLVDDVVTTGVTLAASARALAEVGVVVRGALVLVATPQRSVM